MEWVRVQAKGLSARRMQNDGDCCLMRLWSWCELGATVTNG